MKNNIILTFARTHVVKVRENNDSIFDAELRDNMGNYRAVVKRISKSKVSVSFEGAWQNRIMDLDYAKWDFESIWHDLAAQCVTVKALL